MMKRIHSHFIRFVLIVIFLNMIGCSSDLFRIPKAPEIERMDFSKYEVDPGETVKMTVRVKQTDEALHYEWTSNGGEFIQPADQAEVYWQAPMEGGQYRITIKVSNDDKSATRSQTLTVRSYTEPVVEILDPQNGDYLVQHSEIMIQVFAQHNNGIHHLDFFINDTLKQTINGQFLSSDYLFNTVLSESHGNKEMKVEAYANITGTVGRDSIQIYIEGIVIGKTH